MFFLSNDTDKRGAVSVTMVYKYAAKVILRQFLKASFLMTDLEIYVFLETTSLPLKPPSYMVGA
jgi:hypothetical protein